MCAIDPLEGIRKKANPAIAKFAEAQAFKAENKMMAYEIKKKELMSSGMPPEKASKLANEFIKTLGASANSGAKTNNDNNLTVDKSRQSNERVMGETNIKGEVKSLIDASEDSGNNSDNGNSSGRKSDTFQIADLAKQKGSVKNEVISLFGDD